jgi:NADPH:quinone reductase-like Zn-dependent oxidoreductase
MPKAVRFDEYGDIDVLDVREVPRPTPGPREVLVGVRAAGINPGEATIRRGLLHDRWPATFPSGQGSDLAGVIEEVGPEVTGVAVGDEVIGFTHERASQAELVVVDAGHLTPRPPGVPWEVAGALFVVGSTAWAAVGAVAPEKGETVVVSAAAGGVGTLAVQLLVGTGARVVGLAGAAHHDWLRAHGAVPVTHGDGVADRIRSAADGPVAAFVDAFGQGYVDLAIELGVVPERIDTIVDWDAAGRHHGVRTDGNMAGARPEVLAELAGRIAAGRLDLPIAATYPLDRVRDAFRELEERHTLGKIVLIP